MGNTFAVAVGNIGSNPLELINIEPSNFDINSPDELQNLHNRLALEQN